MRQCSLFILGFGVNDCGVHKHDQGLVTSLQLQTTRPKPGTYMDSLSRLSIGYRMNDRDSRRLPTVALFGILAAVLFVTFCPAIEQTRLEARIACAYRTACEIAQSHIASETSGSTNSLNETDPWGQPYRIETSNDGFRIISNGPNQITTATGTDDDDIHSDMQHSPADAILRAKQRKLVSSQR